MKHYQAINQYTQDFLSAHENGIIFCEGVDDGFFKTIENISSNYREQCFELPCSENASVGMALGAACYGILPILCFQRVEFALLALEQLVNNSSKIHYLSQKKRKNPSLFRFVVGRGWGQGPSHSQSLEAIFAQIPEIQLFLPVFPEDSKFIFNNFIHYNTPSISIEHRWIHYSNPSFRKVEHARPYILRIGYHLTLVASSHNLLMALNIAQYSKDIGIEIEVINLFCLFPQDFSHIKTSVIKTKKLLVLDNGHTSYGVGNAILSSLVQDNINFETSPKILGAKTSFSPSSFRLIEEHYITYEDICAEIIQQLNLSQEKSTQLINYASTISSKANIDQPNTGAIVGPF